MQCGPAKYLFNLTGVRTVYSGTVASVSTSAYSTPQYSPCVQHNYTLRLEKLNAAQ